MAYSLEYIYHIVDKYSAPLKHITDQTKKYDDAVKRATLNTEMMARKLKSVGANAQKVGRALSLRVSAPITAIATVGAVAFARMEKGLIDVNNLLSRDELKRFGSRLDTLHENAIKAGFSIDDVNKGLFDNISALGANTKAFEAFEVAQKLAIGGNTQLGVAVDGITSIMKAYEDQNVSAFEAANAFFSAQVKGKTTVEQLANSIGTIAPTAKLAGVGFKEVLATISALTTGGISTDESVTALNAALLGLAKPQQDAAKLMQRMGIDFGVANIKAKGLRKILEQVASAQKRFGEDAVLQVIPERRALKAIAALANSGKLGLIDETMMKINSDMKTGDGLMRAYGDQLESMTIKFLMMKGEISIAFKKFFIVMGPYLKRFIDMLSKIVQSFAELGPLGKTLVIVFGAIGIGLPPLIIGFGMLVSSLSWILFALPVIKAGLASIAVFMGAISAPAWIAAAALAAVGAAIYQIVQHWESLSAPGFWKDLGGWMKEITIQPIAEGMAMQYAQDKADARQNNKQEVSGNIRVSAANGAKVESAQINLNSGSNLVGVYQ